LQQGAAQGDQDRQARGIPALANPRPKSSFSLGAMSPVASWENDTVILLVSQFVASN
jgi:hypothetical protein